MRILFVDRSTQLKTVHDLKTKARGGMVASLFHVSDYLASQGHDVTVFSDIECTGVTDAKAKWLHEAWGEYDCLIANRGVGEGYPEINAKSRILWTHDLPHSGFIPDPKVMGAFNCTVFMSRYAENVWRLFYRTIGKSAFIPNGVDKSIFYPRQKFLNTMIYASAPNRGLDKLPIILDSVRSRLPDGWKYVINAYSNLSKLHPGEGEDQFNYTPVQESNVTLCDPVPQGELANTLGQAGLMILPSAYPEICSNAVLQALASGTPVITTGNLGATGEWVKHGKSGMLTRSLPHDYMVHLVEMVRNTVRVLESEKLHRKLIQGAVRTKVLTWPEVGRKWEKLIARIGG